MSEETHRRRPAFGENRDVDIVRLAAASTIQRLERERDELRAALAEAAGHVEPVDQNSELAIARWQALAAGKRAEPAIVTSGTEHLAKLIGGLAIGGEDTP